MNRYTTILAVSFLVLSCGAAHGDIHEWAWVDAGNPGLGKYETDIVCPDGADVTALPYARFDLRDLTKAYFIGADLRSAEFYSATLTNADLSSANLAAASFYSATLTNADFTGALVGEVYFYDTTSRGFTAAQLYSTASYQSGDLQAISLGSNDLTGWNFAGKNLTWADFESATLTNADFTGALVSGATFYHTTSKGFTPAQLYSTSSYRSGDLQTIQLAYNDLTGWDFAGQDLDSASFYLATLTNANLRNSNLASAYFSDATLTNADFTGADLRGATYADASLAAATTRNAIRTNGTINGLNLLAGDELLVRHVDSIGVHVEQGMSVDAGAAVVFLLTDGAWGSTVSFAPGISVALGGELELRLADGFDEGSLIGQTYRLFDWQGISPTGQFTLRSAYSWDTSNLYTTGEVTLAPEPSAWGMLLLAAVPLWCACRRRRRSGECQ